MGFLSRLAWFCIGLFVFSFAVLAVNQELGYVPIAYQSGWRKDLGID